jgi:hypothetical protein
MYAPARGNVPGMERCVSRSSNPPSLALRLAEPNAVPCALDHIALCQKRCRVCNGAIKIDRVRKIAAAPLRTLSGVATRFCTPYGVLTQ